MNTLFIKETALLIRRSKHLVIFTGAGISTGSGLPDYRGPDGVWTRRDKGLPPSKMNKSWDEVKPNAAHYALVTLQDKGILKFLISQNVDGLHLISGIKLELLAELHGNRHLMRCLSCDRRMTFKKAGWNQKRWGSGYLSQPVLQGQPRCPVCNGRIISSVVNFGDPLPENDLKQAMEHSARADLFMVIGSSLAVSPANTLPEMAVENRAKLVILNRGKTPLDGLADFHSAEDITILLPEIVKRVLNVQM